MHTLGALIKRNVKIFFKDKVLFFTSLITPLILLVLYSAFLSKVYYDSFVSALPEGMPAPEKLLKGMTAGQLFSSLVAVCGVTVAFCSNMLMVQDKAGGVRGDLTVSPVRKSVLSLAYYISGVISTLAVCLTATAACLVYVACTGWYMRAVDVISVVIDVILIVLFGMGLSSVINYFLSSQGQMSAVGTIVSSGYGFICGAYMPISMFGKGIRRVVSFFPGTYGTSLVRNHAMAGAFAEMRRQGYPPEAIENIRSSVDCSLEFFGHNVPIGAMYGILIGAIIVLICAYVLINVFCGKQTIGKRTSKKAKQ